MVWGPAPRRVSRALKGPQRIRADGMAGERKLRLKGSVGSKMQFPLWEAPDASAQIEAAWSTLAPDCAL